MNSSHETRLLAAVEQAHEQLVLARQERDRTLQAAARTDKICLALQERLLELEAAVRQSEQRRAADADEAVARLTQRHAEFTASLADAARSRDALGQQLHAARASLEEARRARQADEMAAAETLRTHRAEFEVALATAATSRAAAEQQVESLRTTLQHAEARHLLEIAADAERHAVREADAATNLARISDERDTLTRHLNDAAAALEESQIQRAREEADARVALERAEEHRAAAEQQVEHLRATLQHAETRHALQRTTDAKRHAARDAEVAANLAQVSDERDTLARRLSDATAALEESHQQRAREEVDARTTLEATAAALERAEERRAADAIAATAQLAERQAEFEVALAAVAASRAVAEHEIERLRVDYQEAEARHVLERAADAERHAVHDAEVAAHLAQVSAARDAVARQLSDATAALEESHKQRAREEADARATLEATAAALERAEERRAADAIAATAKFAEREADFEIALAAAAASRAAADQEIERLRADSQHAEARHVWERAADAERHAIHDAEVAANLAQVSAARDELARQLSDATAALEESHKQRAVEQADARAILEATAAALERAEERRAADAIEATAKLAEREADFEIALAAAAASRAAADQEIERLRADSQHAEARHVLERAADAERHAIHDAEVAAHLAQVSAARDALAHQLSDATAALEDSQKQRAIDASEARGTLEAAVAQATRAQREADEHHALELAAAASHAEALQAHLDHMVAKAAADRESFERELSDVAAAAQRALERAAQHAESERVAAGAREQELRGELARVRRGLLTAASALRRRTTAQRALAEKRFAEERAEFERHLGARDEAIRQIQATSESELTQLRAEYDHTRHSLEHLRDAFNTLERVSSEHALERARLEGVVADRDSQMSAQEAAHLAAERAGTEALRQAGETLRQTVDANEREARRQFEHAPHALGRVTRGGVLVEANQALARMLGYRSTDDLGKPDLAAAVFEAPADLQWLIDRAETSGAPATVETHWTKKDRSRLTVRLQVVRTNQEWIEIAAEDLTLLRTTEDNLRQARRLEAVGRLASEVAVTCDTLLRGVSHGGQYWLAALGSDLGHRRQGERLLGDVAEATSLLQRLAAYGNEQIDALEPVNLQHVLRNLEPVLKRVVGDDIQVVLPKHIRPYSIDVERTRVERVLVNVASYARERMPHGGRLKIDLASTVVDRTFLDKYPNVRPGPHVIATVTEERSTTPAGLPVPWPAPSIADGATGTGEKPGVDLSALVRLLGDCGGHLWVAAEPPGNMTLKIHLPLRASEHASSPAGSLARSVGSRSLGRWSRH